MTEKPILFTGEMVRAILAGIKTETRRTIRRVRGIGPVREVHDSDTPGYDVCMRSVYRGLWHDLRLEDLATRGPFGGPGDILWVKETFARNVPGCPRGISYRADHVDPRGDGPAHPMRWTPSILMPREASRILLEVEEVWVQHLSDMTVAQILAEGIESEVRIGQPDAASGTVAEVLRARYLRLWDSIYGAEFPSNEDPLVFACRFHVLAEDHR